MTHNNFSVLFFIRKTRSNKNGEAPILMRITVNGIAQEVTIKRTVRPALWDQRAERAIGKGLHSSEVNAYLDTVRGRMNNVVPPPNGT